MSLVLRWLKAYVPSLIEPPVRRLNVKTTSISGCFPPTSPSIVSNPHGVGYFATMLEKMRAAFFSFLSAFNPLRRVIDAAARADMLDYPTTISSPKRNLSTST